LIISRGGLILDNKFGFIGYPLSIDLLNKFNPSLKSLPPADLKDKLTKLPPIIASSITGVRSTTGRELEGIFILVMLLPDQIIELDHKFVIEKIIEAGKLAEKEGAKIIGLGGLTSIIGNQGEIVAKNLNIAVTTGNTYTAATTIEATLKAAEAMGIDIAKATATVIGATGSIGSTCSYILSEKAANLNLVARNQKKLELFSKQLASSGRAKVDYSTNIDKSVSVSDIIISATSTPNAIIDPDYVKPGAVICDVSVPRNVMEKGKKREDILIIDGGLISPPGQLKIDFDIGLPNGTAYACLCETMILALENRFENYTMGPGIEQKKVKEILGLAKKHGFKISGFKSFGRSLTAKDIQTIKNNAIATTGKTK